jgi:hypothetical protein
MLEVLGSPTVHTSGVNAESAITIIAGLVTVLGFIGTLGALAYRRWVLPRRKLEQESKDQALLDAMALVVEPLKRQMENNGGKTFRDSVERRIEELREATGREFKEIRTHLTHQDQDTKDTNKRIDDVYRSLHDQGAAPRIHQ